MTKTSATKTAGNVLTGLCQQVTADVVACSLMLAQVHGYERVEHGKLEQVSPYTREEISAWAPKDPRRVWAAGPGVALYRYNAKGQMEVKWLEGPHGGTGWRPVKHGDRIWDEDNRRVLVTKALTRNSTEITEHHPVLPDPLQRPADPQVEVDPALGKTPAQVQAFRDYLRSKLSPGELEALNRAGVSWHVQTLAQIQALPGASQTAGVYFSTHRSVHVPGDLAKSMAGVPNPPGLPHILLHETGHALDQALGWPSEHDRSGFYDKIAVHSFGEDDYPRSNTKEAFAELFADLKRDRWQDYAHAMTVPAQQQQEWKDYLDRIEHEGLPAELSTVPAPLCVAVLQPNGRLWFGPPGSSPIREA